MVQKISTKSAMQCAIDDMKNSFSKSEASCLSLLTKTAKSLPFGSTKEVLNIEFPEQKSIFIKQIS